MVENRTTHPKKGTFGDASPEIRILQIVMRGNWRLNVAQSRAYVLSLMRMHAKQLSAINIFPLPVYCAPVITAF